MPRHREIVDMRHPALIWHRHFGVEDRSVIRLSIDKCGN
jgi:hypothetical protein